MVHRRFENNNIVDLYQRFIPQGNLKLRFVMEAKTKQLCILDRNTIPVIIDFWLEECDLSAFYRAYRHCPLILITSAEIVYFLHKNNCPLPIEHWPLSYPDIYRMDTNSIEDKKYEFCILGRPNPFFVRLLDEYCSKHLDFTYIHTNGTEYNRSYIDHNGNVVAIDSGRKSYLDMIRKTKISCYTTPGIDEAKKSTNRFNQVTPRLFEMLANGCNVIAHYPDNADTEFYDLKHIVPNVNNYTEFESVLDRMRIAPQHFDHIVEYMNKHYTSSRIPMLKEILQRWNISY
jgi:hypothetical protein